MRQLHRHQSSSSLQPPGTLRCLSLSDREGRRDDSDRLVFDAEPEPLPLSPPKPKSAVKKSAPEGLEFELPELPPLPDAGGGE